MVEANKTYNRASSSKRGNVIEAMAVASLTIRMPKVMEEEGEELEAVHVEEPAAATHAAVVGVAIEEAAVVVVGVAVAEASKCASSSKKETVQGVTRASLLMKLEGMAVAVEVEAGVAVGAVAGAEEVVIGAVVVVVAVAAAEEPVSPFRRASVPEGMAVDILIEVVWIFNYLIKPRP